MLSLLLCFLLLCLPVSARAASFPATSDPTQAAQQRWGAAVPGYVVAGCVPAASATLTVTIPPCRAFVWDATPPPTLRGVDEPTARPLVLPADGTYRLLGRANPAVTPAGATCLPGTHYCWTQGTPPVQPQGTLPLATLAAAGGAVTVTPAGPPAFQVYRPEVFGARGDGVTDDTAAFQLLQATMPPTGGVVALAQGATYHLNTAGGLVWTKTVQLQGTGMAASRITCGTQVGNAPCVRLTGDASGVRDLTVVGEQSNFTNADSLTTEHRAALKVEGDHTWIERVTVRDAIMGLLFQDTMGGGVRASVLTNSLIRRDFASPCNNSAGVMGFGVQQLVVRDSWIDGFGQNAAFTANGRLVLVEGNHVQDACDAGIYLPTTEESAVRNNTVLRPFSDGIKMRGSYNSVVGNLVTAESTAVAAMDAGITLTPFGAAVNGISAVRLLVANNTVLCSGCFFGIYVGAYSGVPEGGVLDVVVSNNIVRFIGAPQGATTDATGIGLLGPNRQVVVTGNVIEDAYNIGIRTGALTGSAPTRNLVISHNVIQSVGKTGALARGMLLQHVEDCLVQGNSVQDVLDSGPGMHLVFAQRCDISNNVVGSLSTPPQTGTILTESSGQVGLTNTYRNNRTTGVTLITYAIFTGSTSRVESNETLVSATLTSDLTIQPGQAQRWVLTPSGGPRTVNVSAIWPATDVMLCNRSGTENLVFAPLAETIGPGKCRSYQAQNPATFWRIDQTP